MKRELARRTTLLTCLLFATTAAFAQPATDPTYFSTKLYPVLEAAQCRGCHAKDGVASATRIHFPEDGASPDIIQAFGISLGAFVDRADRSKSLLLNKPTNRRQHTGGERIKPGSD